MCPQVFQTLSLADPLSQAHTRSEYSAELTQWRATLRPFLFPGGTLAQQRPLESCTAGCTMSQGAIHLTTEGIRRRREWRDNVFLRCRQFVYECST